MRSFMLIVLILALPGAHADDEAPLWQALREGHHVALIRHALAPGTFDPETFTIGDCNTQRNLSDEGRAQARALGERFRAHGVTNVRIYSSQWCRCVDTATEMRLGPVTPLPALNSLHHEHADPNAQTAEIRELIRRHQGAQTLVLVTHQVNIGRLTGTHAGSGELVVARVVDGELIVTGRIQ